MNAVYEDRALADKVVEKLRVYAQSQRLMILSCLLRGGRTVGEIEAATGIGQPALSQQLAALRRAEMVTTQRTAKQVHYDLADEDVALCVRSMEAIFSKDATTDESLVTALRSQGGQRDDRCRIEPLRCARGERYCPYGRGWGSVSGIQVRPARACCHIDRPHTPLRPLRAAA